MRRKRRLSYKSSLRRSSRKGCIFYGFVLMLCLLSIYLVLLEPTARLQPLRLFPNPVKTTVSVYLTDEQTIRSLSLDAYLMRVVAAEMPSSFHPEALRAQAVASRSYTCFRMRKNGGSGCASHPQADVCTDHTCCQAYLGSDSEIDTRILQAVMDTSGEVLTYENKVINALYHACSGGATEDVEAVFSTALPYLRSVESPNEESYPQYAASTVFSSEELSKLLPIDKSVPLRSQFQCTYARSGRIDSVSVNNRVYSGVQFRKLLKLPSTRISLSFSDSQTMTVSTIGSGHGVGMSQTGADAMAQRGTDYRTILKWYYTDCEITNIE